MSTTTPKDLPKAPPKDVPKLPPKDVLKVNPYSLKKSKVHTNNRFNNINTFLSIVTDYVNIIVEHDESLKQKPWYGLWLLWIEDGILNKPTLYVASVIVDLPPTVEKSNKSVSTYILDKLPVLERFTSIPKQTKDKDPILHLTRPTVKNLSKPIFQNKPSTSDIRTKTFTEDKDKSGTSYLKSKISSEDLPTKPKYVDVVKQSHSSHTKSDTSTYTNTFAPLAQDDDSKSSNPDEIPVLESFPMDNYYEVSQVVGRRSFGI